MNATRWVIGAVIAAALNGAAVDAETVGWRTDGTGMYPDAAAPAHWSPTRNVAWATPMPDWSNSTPVVAGDRVFVCAEPTTLLCVRLSDGEILWERDNSTVELLSDDEAQRVRQQLDAATDQMKELRQGQSRLSRLRRILRRQPNNAEAKAEQQTLAKHVAELERQLAPLAAHRLPPAHNANGYSSCTPVADGKHVYAVFGNGVAAAYDLDGDRRWIRQVDQPSHKWGHSSSPALVDGVLVVQFDDLIGLDARTGEELWRTAVGQKFGSPIAIEVDGVPVIASPSGALINPADGRTLTKLNTSLTYCAPVYVDGVLYFIEKNAKAFKLENEGGVIRAEPLWSASIKGDRHYASPVIHDGLIYTVSRKEEFTVMDAATGKVAYEKKLDLGGPMPNSAYPSVAMAGGLIYVGAENGVTLVLQPGRSYEEVARNKLDGYRSCPVFVDNQMLVRGFNKLWCIKAE